MKNRNYNFRKDGTLSIGYFGAQGTHAHAIFEHLEGATRYIDLTAGGMGIPFQICRDKRIPVTVNDIGYYSHCCAHSVFSNLRCDELRFWESVLEGAKERCTNFQGMLYRLLELGDWFPKTNTFKTLNTKCMSFIDYLCSTEDSWRIKSAVGRMLLEKFTFRGMTTCSKLTNGTKLEDLTIDDLIELLLYNIMYFQFHNTQLHRFMQEDNFVSWNDSSAFVKEYDNFEGSVVYMDPAWPWNEPSTTNPYFLSSVVVPCILSQTWDPEELIVLQPWEYGNQKRILDDIELWVRTPLEKGARRVIVNTQSTNYPDPEGIVEPFLKERFKFKGYLEWKAFSALAKHSKNSFKEYAWILEAR